MFLHFHFVTLVIKPWKCKIWRISDNSAYKIFIYDPILKM